MKRIFLAIVLSALFAFAAWAESSKNVFFIDGKAGPTTTVTLADNVAHTLSGDSVPVTLTYGGVTLYPRAVLVSVETNGLRVTFGGSTPSQTLGHVIAAGSSAQFSGEDMIKAFKYSAAVAGSYPTMQFTVLY